MALPANRALCQVCAHPLVRNGTTSAGRTRWRCKHCGASTTRTRTEITAAAQMNAFHTWLLGTTTQSAHGGTGRSFRAATTWCWNITVPPIEPTGVIADQVMVDGTYFNGWCVLIAFNTTYVIDQQWCDREKHTAWAQLLARILAPRLVIVDGGTGIHTALRETWAQTPVQRCCFHILQTIRRHTTYQPRTTPGREILALTRALMRVTTLGQASGWLSEYSQWEYRWDELLKQRSYPRTGVPRPTDVPLTRSWWYTHRRLRRVRGLFRSLIGHENLFAFLDPALTSAAGHLLHRTTSPLVGRRTRRSKSCCAPIAGCLKPMPAPRWTGCWNRPPTTHETRGRSLEHSCLNHRNRLPRLRRNRWARCSMTRASAGRTATGSSTAGADDHGPERDWTRPGHTHIAAYNPKMWAEG